MQMERRQSYFLPTLRPKAWRFAVVIHMEAGGRGGHEWARGGLQWAAGHGSRVDETSESPTAENGG